MSLVHPLVEASFLIMIASWKRVLLWKCIRMEPARFRNFNDIIQMHLIWIWIFYISYRMYLNFILI